MRLEKKDEKELTLEESFDRLDHMIHALEDRNITLEESFQTYQEGMNLLKHCNEMIDTVEKKMKIMNEDGSLEDFE